MQNLVRPNGPRQSDTAKQQLAAAFSVLALALCAVVFVVTSSGAQIDGTEDSIDNILTPYERQSLAVAAARETNLVMGAGQEGTDASAIKAAWATFKDSKDEEVLKDLSAWDPKEEEANIAGAITDMKALGLETKAEGLILKKLSQPDRR